MTLALAKFDREHSKKMFETVREHNVELVKSTSMDSLKRRLSEFNSKRKLKSEHLESPRKSLDKVEAEYAVEKGLLTENNVESDLWKILNDTTKVKN